MGKDKCHCEGGKVEKQSWNARRGEARTDPTIKNSFLSANWLKLVKVSVHVKSNGLTDVIVITQDSYLDGLSCLNGCTPKLLFSVLRSRTKLL